MPNYKSRDEIVDDETASGGAMEVLNLDNPDELSHEVNEEILEDLSDLRGSNDLADMIESDFELSNGGDLDGETLLEGLAIVLDSIPKIQKSLQQ